MISRRLAKNGWNVWHGALAGGMVLAAMLVTWRGWYDIVTLGVTWSLAGHIFLVPVVATWLFWVRRKRFQFCTPTDPWWGLVLATIGAVCFIYGDQRVRPVVFHFGTVLLPIGCVVAILGHQVLRAYFSAFVALLAIIPPPIAWAEALAEPLQEATARLTCGVYAMLGSTASFENGYLQISGTAIRLADICDALPMAMSLALVTYGFVFGSPLRVSARAALMLTSPLAAVLFNAVALVATFWLWGYMPMESADLWHRVSEWVMLLVAFLSLIGLIRLLTWVSVPVRHYTLAYDR